VISPMHSPALFLLPVLSSTELCTFGNTNCLQKCHVVILLLDNTQHLNLKKSVRLLENELLLINTSKNKNIIENLDIKTYAPKSTVDKFQMFDIPKYMQLQNGMTIVPINLTTW
jgi:hypothetical protein